MQLFVLIACTSLVVGIIQAQSCNTGFWGEVCEKKCETHCSCRGCDKPTGTCNSCSMGYWGSHCNRLCPLTCRQHCDGYRYYECSLVSNVCGPYCDQNDGICYRCSSDGLWGDFCNKSCDLKGANCASCDKSGKGCNTCKSGFWNTTCNSRCPTNCAKCSISTGKCYRCMPEYWGESCENRCTIQHCRYCNQNGACEHCRDGFWGEACDKTCVSRHCGFCHRTSGICERCEDGYWGQVCENKCGDGCADGRCEKIAGRCENCKRHYWGDKCNMTDMIMTEEPPEVTHADEISEDPPEVIHADEISEEPSEVKHPNEISVAGYFGISVGTSVLVIVIFLLVYLLIVFVCCSRTGGKTKGNPLTKIFSRVSDPKSRIRNGMQSTNLSVSTNEAPDRHRRDITGTSNPAADGDSGRDVVTVEDVITVNGSNGEQTPSFYEQLHHGQSSDKDYDDMRQSVYENCPD